MRVVGVKQSVPFYSLDVIISVGYRVKSQNGIIFRKWATSILKDYMIKGFTVDESKDGETILIVSHRGYFNYMLEALFNMDLDELERENPNYLETLIPNASVAKFYYEDDKYILEEMPR